MARLVVKIAPAQTTVPAPTVIHGDTSTRGWTNEAKRSLAVAHFRTHCSRNAGLPTATTTGVSQDFFAKSSKCITGIPFWEVPSSSGLSTRNVRVRLPPQHSFASQAISRPEAPAPKMARPSGPGGGVLRRLIPAQPSARLGTALGSPREDLQHARYVQDFVLPNRRPSRQNDDPLGHVFGIRQHETRMRVIRAVRLHVVTARPEISAR